MNFNEELKQRVEQINALLAAKLPAEEGMQQRVAEAMNYSVNAGGKRLRPMLLLEVYRLLGGTDEKITEPFMAALECIHTYSLVHDDLPAMDNDDYRRGKLTTHKKFGEDFGVLAGDGLVGIVTEVNKSYARVRSIIDDESSVTGSFLKTSDMCFVNGNLKLIGKGMIDISGIPADAEVKDGYEVVTSPVSDKYLPGILIGYARDIKTDSSNITQSAHLTPAADFSGLDMVLVITEVKDSGDLEDILN